MTEEQLLIEKIKTGSVEAFTQLYDMTYNRLFYIVNKMLGNESDTLDVLQNTYVNIYTHFMKFEYRGEGSLAAWCSRIANNEALMFKRRKNPLLFSELASERTQGEIQFDVEDTRVDVHPELAYDVAETKKIVNEMLNSLPEDQRICVIMFYLEGITTREIAQILGCSENTVKSRLNYARKKILSNKENLEKKGIRFNSYSPFAFFIYIVYVDSSRAIVPGTGPKDFLAGIVNTLWNNYYNYAAASRMAADVSIQNGAGIGAYGNGAKWEAYSNSSAINYSANAAKSASANASQIATASAGTAGVVAGGTAGVAAGTGTGAAVASASIAGSIIGKVIIGTVVAATVITGSVTGVKVAKNRKEKASAEKTTELVTETEEITTTEIVTTTEVTTTEVSTEEKSQIKIFQMKKYFRTTLRMS